MGLSIAYDCRVVSAHSEQLSHQIGRITSAMADGDSTEEPVLAGIRWNTVSIQHLLMGMGGSNLHRLLGRSR